MKKVLSMMFVALFVLVGCGPQEKVVYVEKEPEKVTIEYYSEYNGKLPTYAPLPGVEMEGDWGPYVEKLYEARCPWVDIVPTISVYAGGGTEQLSTRIMANRAPTVYSGYVGRFFDYAGLLLELPVPSSSFREGTLDGATVNGRLVGYPVETNPAPIWANVTLMRVAGCNIPEGMQWTTVEASECAKKVWEYNESVLFHFFALEQSSQQMYWQMMAGGAELFAPGDCSHTTFGDGDYAVRYLEWMYSLLPYLPDNPVNYISSAPLKAWTAGKQVLGPRGWVPRLQIEVDEGRLEEMPEVKLLQYPHLPDVPATLMASGAHHAIGIFASAVEDDDKLKAEAIKFVEWLTGPEVGYAYSIGRRSARHDGFKGTYPQEVWDEVEISGSVSLGEHCGKYNQARTLWSEETQAFWLGQQTAQETIDNFVNRYDELL